MHCGIDSLQKFCDGSRVVSRSGRYYTDPEKDLNNSLDAQGGVTVELPPLLGMWETLIPIHREGRRSQWVNATLARSLLAGVSTAKVIREC